MTKNSRLKMSADNFRFYFKTRWNSTFFMVKRLLQHQEVVKSVFVKRFKNLNSLQKSSLEQIALTLHDWEILQSLHKLLEPFELATRVLSAKKYPTLALAYTTINILRRGLEEFEDDDKLVAVLKKSLLVQFKYYFDSTMSDQQKELMIVSISSYNERL